MSPYKLKNIVVHTYDGDSLKVEIDGLYNHPRKKMEDILISEFRKIIKNDIPVSVDFRMEYV